MVKQEFNELEVGGSAEDTPGDEFVWTDDQDEGAPEGAPLPGAQAQPVILDEIPEFREFQSRSDQRIGALQRDLASRDKALEQLRAEQRTIQDRLDADRLRNATPQQIHAYYQERTKREATEQAAQAEGQALGQQIAGRAAQVLQAVGMNRETPGLRFGGDVDWQAYADLLESVLEVQNRAGGGAEGGTRPGAAPTEPPEPGPQGVARADQVGGGATPATRGRVSTARGQKPPNLWGAYFKELDALAKGDYHAVVTLRMKYQKRGLDFSKMPRRLGRR